MATDLNKRRNQNIVSAIVIFAFTGIISFLCYNYGVKVGQKEICGPLVDKLQEEIDNQKALVIEKNIDWLKATGCKNVWMRVANTNNEVKIVPFIYFGKVSNLKIVAITFDGREKDFEYTGFMKKVLSVECGDAYIGENND